MNKKKLSRGGSLQSSVTSVLAALLCILIGLLVGFLLLLPYGRTSVSDLSLYDGDYSETQLMHHMVKMLVEEQTGLSVSIGDQMSQVNNFKAMVGSNHTCDLMISYDGTLLTRLPDRTMV